LFDCCSVRNTKIVECRGCLMISRRNALLCVAIYRMISKSLEIAIKGKVSFYLAFLRP
jgi:hypothetical protein